MQSTLFLYGAKGWLKQPVDSIDDASDMLASVKRTGCAELWGFCDCSPGELPEDSPPRSVTIRRVSTNEIWLERAAEYDD